MKTTAEKAQQFAARHRKNTELHAARAGLARADQQLQGMAVRLSRAEAAAKPPHRTDDARQHLLCTEREKHQAAGRDTEQLIERASAPTVDAAPAVGCTLGQAVLAWLRGDASGLQDARAGLQAALDSVLTNAERAAALVELAGDVATLRANRDAAQQLLDAAEDLVRDNHAADARRVLEHAWKAPVVAAAIEALRRLGRTVRPSMVASEQI